MPVKPGKCRPALSIFSSSATALSLAPISQWAGERLRGLAERKVEDYFGQRGYKSAAEFLKQFRQVSAVLLKADDNQLWLNSLAKHPLPKERSSWRSNG